MDFQLCVCCRRSGHRARQCYGEPQEEADAATLLILSAAQNDGPLCRRCETLWPRLITCLNGCAPTRTITPRNITFYYVNGILDAKFRPDSPLCRLVFVHLQPRTSQDWELPSGDEKAKHCITLRQRWNAPSQCPTITIMHLGTNGV
jgi:hypothetical protein